MARRKDDKWIQKAIKQRGALKKWLKKEYPELLKKNGEITWTKLRDWYERHKEELTEHRKHQIQLAFTLHKLALRRRKKK
jgi:hypothetical protein